MVSSNLVLKLFIDFPCDSKRLSFELMTDTDLFELVKHKTCALSCAFSSDGSKLAMYCRDRRVRVFEVKTGKLKKIYNETLETYID